MGTHLQEPSHLPSPESCLVLVRLCSKSHDTYTQSHPEPTRVSPVKPFVAFPKSSFHMTSMPSGTVTSGTGCCPGQRPDTGQHSVSGALKCPYLCPEPPKVPNTNNFPSCLLQCPWGQRIQAACHHLRSANLSSLTLAKSTPSALKHGAECCGGRSGAFEGRARETLEDGEVPD